MKVLTLWRGKVDDVAVALEHVDLLDGLDGLDVELLQRLLELLVVAARAGRSPLDLSPGGTLATVSPLDEKHNRQQYTTVIRGHRIGAAARG